MAGKGVSLTFYSHIRTQESRYTDLAMCVTECVCFLISLTVLSTAGLVNGGGHGDCSYGRR